MTYFVWTGTNGGVVFGLYWGETATATDLGDCASFATSAFGSHTTTLPEYIANGYTGGFTTSIDADTADDIFYYCWHFHTSDFQIAPPTLGTSSATIYDTVNADFSAVYYPGVSSGSTCVADSTKTFSSTGGGMLEIG